MRGILRLTDEGWGLESGEGEILKNGEYPLVEDSKFIENAADMLDHPNYHVKPYKRVDERSGQM